MQESVQIHSLKQLAVYAPSYATHPVALQLSCAPQQVASAYD